MSVSVFVSSAFGDSSIHLSHRITSIQIKSSCVMYALYIVDWFQSLTVVLCIVHIYRISLVFIRLNSSLLKSDTRRMISQVFRYTQGGGQNDPSPPKSEMCTPCITSYLIFFLLFKFSFPPSNFFSFPQNPLCF